MKFPAKFFRDFSIDGPQHIILSLILQWYVSKNQLHPSQYELAKEDPKELLVLFKSIESLFVEVRDAETVPCV